MSVQGATGSRPEGFFRPDQGAYTHPGGTAPAANAHGGSTDLSLSPEARVIENEARHLRNQERASRREAGRTDVEEDEQLLELVPQNEAGETPIQPVNDAQRLAPPTVAKNAHDARRCVLSIRPTAAAGLPFKLSSIVNAP